MAKRKKAKRTTTRRRRRMSGVGSHTHELMEVVGLVLGNVGATIVQRQATTINPKIVSGLEIVGGYFLKKNAHSPLMSGIAYGLMSAGAIGLTHELGIIHGVEDFVSGMYGDGQGYIDDERNLNGLSNESINGLGNEMYMGAAGGSSQDQAIVDAMYD